MKGESREERIQKTVFLEQMDALANPRRKTGGYQVFDCIKLRANRVGEINIE